MNVSKITELTVFESPDGGRTVYARRPGSKVRELHWQDPKLIKELAELEQQTLTNHLYTYQTFLPTYQSFLPTY